LRDNGLGILRCGSGNAATNLAQKLKVKPVQDPPDGGEQNHPHAQNQGGENNPIHVDLGFAYGFGKERYFHKANPF